MTRGSAEIIRQLVIQATPETFPPSWHMIVDDPSRGRRVNRSQAVNTSSADEHLCLGNIPTGMCRAT
jgi:hypothetical protein